MFLRSCARIPPANSSANSKSRSKKGLEKTREKVPTETYVFHFRHASDANLSQLTDSGAHKNTYLSLFWCAFPTNDISLTIILHKRAC